MYMLQKHMKNNYAILLIKNNKLEEAKKYLEKSELEESLVNYGNINIVNNFMQIRTERSKDNLYGLFSYFTNDEILFSLSKQTCLAEDNIFFPI